MTKDSLGTVWPADPHTLAKHHILRRYLEAWYPILTRHASASDREVLFIDGFAGPGEYEEGEPGSPVIAIESAIKHSHDFPAPVHFVFIEEREDRYEHLRAILARWESRVRSSPNVSIDSVLRGDCHKELAALLDRYASQRQAFGPALAFLDQFGYGSVSMELISRIMSWPQCEVFSFLNARDMNRWMPDLTKAPALDRAFGDERWREALDAPEKNRREQLLELYENALRQLGEVKYVQTFRMFDERGDLLYWLLFCTNHLAGLREMKRAMWDVDKKGNFRFSDRDDPNQLGLLEDNYSEKWLADHLVSQFSGRGFWTSAIEEYVLTRTPCYLFRGALARLERERRVSVERDADERRGGFSARDFWVEFRPTHPRLFE